MNRKTTRLAAGAALFSLTLALGACGSDDKSGSASGATGSGAEIELLPEDEDIAAKVPDEIRDRGTLIVATDATAPPNQFFDEDGKTIIGNEVDFVDQIASVMGLEVQWENIAFDSIIPGLEAGRYDLAMSGMRDIFEREELVDFVTYAKAGPQLFGKKENAEKVSTIEDMCGYSFALQSGTLQEELAVEQSEKCEANSEEPIDIKRFKDQAAQVQAVASGQVDFGAQNSPNNAYMEVQTDGTMVGIGEPFGEGPWGMPVPKGSDLLEPLHEATVKLLESPQYDEILEKWGVQDQAIEEAVINGAIS